MACNSFSSTAVGSTRGFDQLFPIQPSVVNEQRKYVYDNDFNNIVNAEEPSLPKPKPKKKEKKDENKKVEDPKEVMTKFEYRCQGGRVDLALSCHGWKPDISLNKVGGDLFSVEVPLANHQKVYYKYVIDGQSWVCDDNQQKEDDGKGNVNNIVVVDVGGSGAFKKKNFDDSGNFGQKEYHVKDLKMLRRELNRVRKNIANYKNEFYLHHENQYLCIFRTFVIDKEYISNIPNFDGYALICRTGYDMGGTQPARIELPGIYSQFVCASSIGVGRIDVDGFRKRGELYGTDSDVYFTRDGKYLNGLCNIYQENGRSIINFNGYVKPNTAIILKFKLTDEVRNSLVNVERSLNQLSSDWKNLTQNVDICDINLVLYKCEKEEQDNTKGERGVYAFDNFGPLCYAGISHLHKMLNKFKLTKENHPILDNIRTGDWLLSYCVKRLKGQPNLNEISNILDSIYNSYTKLLVHHKPVFITKIIDTLYNMMILKLFDLMKNKNVINFSTFGRALLEAVPEYNGYVESSRFKHREGMPFNKLSLSAGLPFFSTEYMRCWGRDTFISLKGLLLIPGLFEEAKSILLSYASVMRHGLIPNLLDSGINSRYNARDATWFFMKSFVDYVEMSKDYDIVNTPVSMVFLSDDYNDNNNRKNNGDKKEMKLCEIVQEILQKHMDGIKFREWRAGTQIDSDMTDEGFNIEIHVNPKDGFIYGGNQWNCGTWMDKMGSSEKAGNKGHPSTPRNGADCEIIGLLYYTLVHLNSLNQANKYPFNSVRSSSGELTFADWANKIKDNFEKMFFIERRNENAPHDNTYRDYITVDRSDPRHESQLRPNIFITLAVAPELFNRDHAIKFMQVAEQFLVVKNCVGTRTLDYSDKNYNGNYDVHNDSNDYHLAHGLNYHNGPEWVWPSGFYLMAKLKFNNLSDNKEIFADLCQRLLPFQKYIKDDKWSGLPELTNKDGAFCEGSCPTQAWSVATLIEALYELCQETNSFENNKNIQGEQKRPKKKVNQEKMKVENENFGNNDNNENSLNKQYFDYIEGENINNNEPVEEVPKKTPKKKIVRKVKSAKTGGQGGESSTSQKKKRVVKKKKVDENMPQEENNTSGKKEVKKKKVIKKTKKEQPSLQENEPPKAEEPAQEENLEISQPIKEEEKLPPMNVEPEQPKTEPMPQPEKQPEGEQPEGEQPEGEHQQQPEGELAKPKKKVIKKVVKKKVVKKTGVEGEQSTASPTKVKKVKKIKRPIKEGENKVNLTQEDPMHPEIQAEEKPPSPKKIKKKLHPKPKEKHPTKQEEQKPLEVQEPQDQPKQEPQQLEQSQEQPQQEPQQLEQSQEQPKQEQQPEQLPEQQPEQGQEMKKPKLIKKKKIVKKKSGQKHPSKVGDSKVVTEQNVAKEEVEEVGQLQPHKVFKKKTVKKTIKTEPNAEENENENAELPKKKLVKKVKSKKVTKKTTTEQAEEEANAGNATQNNEVETEEQKKSDKEKEKEGDCLLAIKYKGKGKENLSKGKKAKTEVVKKVKKVVKTKKSKVADKPKEESENVQQETVQKMSEPEPERKRQIVKELMVEEKKEVVKETEPNEEVNVKEQSQEQELEPEEEQVQSLPLKKSVEPKSEVVSRKVFQKKIVSNKQDTKEEGDDEEQDQGEDVEKEVITEEKKVVVQKQEMGGRKIYTRKFVKQEVEEENNNEEKPSNSGKKVYVEENEENVEDKKDEEDDGQEIVYTNPKYENVESGEDPNNAGNNEPQNDEEGEGEGEGEGDEDYEN